MPSPTKASESMHDLQQSVLINAPIEQVWAEITKLGAVQKAMMDTVLHAVIAPGAALRYTSRDGRRTFIAGEILEVEPPTTLSHTYSMTMRDDPDTVVTWHLEPAGEQSTRVTVHHSGWPAGTKGLDKIDATWDGILADLKRLLEEGDISLKSRVTFALMRRLHWVLPAKTKTPDGALEANT